MSMLSICCAPRSKRAKIIGLALSLTGGVQHVHARCPTEILVLQHGYTIRGYSYNGTVYATPGEADQARKICFAKEALDRQRQSQTNKNKNEGSDSNSADDAKAFFKKHRLTILIGGGISSVVILGLLIWSCTCCCCPRRKDETTTDNGFVPPPPAGPVYGALQPHPLTALPMHAQQPHASWSSPPAPPAAMDPSRSCYSAEPRDGDGDHNVRRRPSYAV